MKDRTQRCRCAVVAFAAALAHPLPAWADPAMVLVESLSAPVPGVAEMDYIAPGTTIDLGTSTVIVLDHLAACTRETAKGGVLTVGSPTSHAEHGAVTRSRLDCDGHQLQLDASMASGGGQVYRGAVPDPLVLRSTVPVILASQGGALRIERLDQPAAPIELQAPAPPGGKATRIDLAQSHLALVAGGNYRLLLGERSVTFRIAPDAKGAEAPLLVRLLPI